MEAMPPIDCDKLATKDDLAALGSDLRTEMATMRADINAHFVSQMRLTVLMQLATLGAMISFMAALQ